MAREKHQLPKNLERLLASLALLYKKQGKELLRKVIVNSQYRVLEEYSYDGWDGGQYGHAVYFQVPETLYHEIMENARDLGREITQGLNQLANFSGEHIDDVFLELDTGPEIGNWRKRSGVLMQREPMLAPARDEDAARIWGAGYLRVFLSHKAEHKVKAKELKDCLALYGVAGFVAHEDIEPTKEWQDEIEKALRTMQVMVVLMTENFHESNWTDQEVGIAIGRGVPIIVVRLGKDPYGFIGRYQGMAGGGKTTPQLAKGLFEVFMKHSEICPMAIDGLISAIEASQSFDHANALSEFLSLIERVSSDQLDRLIKAFNENIEVRKSFGFNGKKPGLYGSGLPYHLERITGYKYRFDRSERLVRVDSERQGPDSEVLPF